LLFSIVIIAYYDLNLCNRTSRLKQKDTVSSDLL
jgi:hypothetical protein